MIPRPGHLAELERLLKNYPVVSIVGARQIGKTTLARMLSARRKGEVRHFDLEDPWDLNQLSDPMLTLEGLRGLIVLDEIHRRPELFPVLRVLADRRPLRARFLVLGSASPELLRQSSESLAGRIAYYFLPGLGLEEVGREKLDRLWLRRRFPRAFLAKTAAASFAWRREKRTSLLRRESSNRIHLERFSCRDQTCDESNSREDDAHDNEGCCVRGRYVEQYLLNKPGGPERSHQT